MEPAVDRKLSGNNNNSSSSSSSSNSNNNNSNNNSTSISVSILEITRFALLRLYSVFTGFYRVLPGFLC